MGSSPPSIHDGLQSLYSLKICYLTMIHTKADISNGNPTVHELKLQRECTHCEGKGRMEASLTLRVRLLRILVLELHQKLTGKPYHGLWDKPDSSLCQVTKQKERPEHRIKDSEVNS